LAQKYTVPTFLNSGQAGLLEHIYFPDGPELSSVEREEVVKIAKTLQARYEEEKERFWDSDSNCTAEETFDLILAEEPHLSESFHRVGQVLRWLLAESAQHEATKLDRMSSRDFSIACDRENEAELTGPDLIVRTLGNLVSQISRE
jgi:hypothetical protein